MAQRRGGGKNRKITAEIKIEIVEGMAAGHTLLDMCEKHGLERSGVWRAVAAGVPLPTDPPALNIESASGL